MDKFTIISDIGDIKQTASTTFLTSALQYVRALVREAKPKGRVIIRIETEKSEENGLQV